MNTLQFPLIPPTNDNAILHIGKLWTDCAIGRFGEMQTKDRITLKIQVSLTAGFLLRFVSPMRRLELVSEFWDAWPKDYPPKPAHFFKWWQWAHGEEYVSCVNSIEAHNSERVTGIKPTAAGAQTFAQIGRAG